MDFRNVHYGISLWNYFLLGVVTQAFNPNTQEAEADGSFFVSSQDSQGYKANPVSK